MIKINLVPSESQGNLTTFLGINFSYLNFKYSLVFFICVYAVEPIIDVIYLDQVEVAEASVALERGKVRKVISTLRGYDVVKNQVRELNEQEKALENKVRVVKKIVEKRQNPFKVLKYIADNTPPNVWIIELELDDKKLKLVGYSRSWKSIGKFIENLKSSIFFDENVNYERPKDLAKSGRNTRIEKFEVTTNIVSFK
jgi:hypothetical protein